MGISRLIYNTHLVPLQLKGLKLHGDAILSGGDHLPHAVLVGRILFGPARRADGAVQLGEEAAAGRWTHTQTVGRAKHAITASPPSVLRAKAGKPGEEQEALVAVTASLGSIIISSRIPVA